MNAATANFAWLASSGPAWLRFRHALRRPEESQRGILRNLLARNSTSAFGRAHGFSDISDYEQFRARVPVVDYDSLETWIGRIMRGETSVLTSEPATRLVPTSGSTGGCKLIPYTATFQRELNAAIGPWIFDLVLQRPHVAGGPAYWSISPAIPSMVTDSAVPIGFDDDSAYVGTFRQRFVEAAFAVPSILRLVSDIKTSRYLTILCLLRQRELRLISVWHPSFLSLLINALPVHWDELIFDVERGGYHRSKGIPLEVQRALASAPAPRRAAEMRRLGPASLHALWPRLRMVSCWGDGQAAIAQSDLREQLPIACFQSKGLLATEAFVSIPFRGHHPAAITSHFLEFVDECGQLHLAHELRVGKQYEVIVTTGAGLYRYRLGDLVTVDGFIESTPSLRFVGRVGNVSDLCGEKLAERFVTRAIQEACASLGCAPRFVMLAPETREAFRCYTLFTEGSLPPDFPVELEQELRKNPHYALCRDLGQLGPLGWCQIAGSAYEAYCTVEASGGQRIGNIKPRALSLRADWRARFGIRASPNRSENEATRT